jgi:hypothetical protein
VFQHGACKKLEPCPYAWSSRIPLLKLRISQL